MDRSAMTVHRGLGEAVQTGVILALGENLQTALWWGR